MQWKIKNKKQEKRNDKIIIRDMSNIRGRGECAVSGSILYNALGVVYKSMFFFFIINDEINNDLYHLQEVLGNI